MPFQGRVEIPKDRFHGKGKIRRISLRNGRMGNMGDVNMAANVDVIERDANFAI
jgi:hypothetical protein